MTFAQARECVRLLQENGYRAVESGPTPISGSWTAVAYAKAETQDAQQLPLWTPPEQWGVRQEAK